MCASIEIAFAEGELVNEPAGQAGGNLRRSWVSLCVGGQTRRLSQMSERPLWNRVLLKVFIYSEPPLAFPDPFLNRQRANGFIRDDTGLRGILQERIRERNKAPQERQREICEDFYLCEQYAINHGYPAAYRHYFGRRRNK
uniref:Matrix Gla protein n=1 Tax=Pavo cristatus TaxID=9049 RepID=A0A8C9FSC6_PAVCR